MSAPRKRWDDHSARWKRDASKQGMTRSRWDAWFNLSPTARNTTDIRRYAQGESIAQQRRQAMEDAAVERMQSLNAESSSRTIRLGVKEMSSRHLRWTVKAQDHQIRRRAVQPPSSVTGVRNPWWYR